MIAAALLAGAVLAGCGAGDGATVLAPRQLVLVLGARDAPASAALRCGAAAVAGREGYALRVLGPRRRSAGGQILAVDRAIDDKPAGVVLVVDDPGALVVPERSLRATGITVVRVAAVDRPPAVTGARAVATLIGRLRGRAVAVGAAVTSARCPAGSATPPRPRRSRTRRAG